jgi:hypothetical protein
MIKTFFTIKRNLFTLFLLLVFTKKKRETVETEMAKYAQLRQDTFNKTIISLIFSLDETRRKKKEVIRFPWERYFKSFIILTLLLVMFDPAGKEYYSPYFVFMFGLLSVLGWQDWKKIREIQEEQKRFRRERINRIKKAIKEEFQHEQEKLTRRVHDWKRRRITELQRRVVEEERRNHETRLRQRTRGKQYWYQLQQLQNYYSNQVFYRLDMQLLRYINSILYKK